MVHDPLLVDLPEHLAIEASEQFRATVFE